MALAGRVGTIDRRLQDAATTGTGKLMPTDPRHPLTTMTQGEYLTIWLVAIVVGGIATLLFLVIPLWIMMATPH